MLLSCNLSQNRWYYLTRVFLDGLHRKLVEALKKGLKQPFLACDIMVAYISKTITAGWGVSSHLPSDKVMNEKIQSVLNSLPRKPGIYLMKDAQGTILYVGKAISLYNRVRSYFQESTDLSPKNRSMIAKVDDIEFLVVKNEVEALVLESNYIKQYRPKYNVLL